MIFTPWQTAHGEAQPAWLSVADTVAIAPMDDSVDTNTVVIEGAGTITSFGDCQNVVRKHVKFVPLVMRDGERAAATILLVNSPHLNLLSGQQRSISKEAFGDYQCDGDNNWTEVSFSQKGTALAGELEERIVALEEKMKDL
jgi:hypothetical protein